MGSVSGNQGLTPKQLFVGSQIFGNLLPPFRHAIVDKAFVVGISAMSQGLRRNMLALFKAQLAEPFLGI